MVGLRSTFIYTARLTGVLGAATLLAACAAPPPPTPDRPLLSAPAKYARGGVQFSYPSSWSLEEKKNSDGNVLQSSVGVQASRDISVGAKGNAGALLKVFEDAPEQRKLDQFISDFSETLKDKVPDLVTLTEVTQSSVAQRVAGAESQGVRKQFLFEVFWKRFSVSVDFHRIDGATRSVFLVTVNTDGNVAVIPGFELIRRTLKVH